MPRYKSKSYRNRSHSLRRIWLAGLFVALIVLIPAANIKAATLSSASLLVGDPRPSNLSTPYTFTGSSVTTGAPGTIRCIRLVWSDTPSGSTVPAGMSTNGGGVTLDTANTNYMPTPASWTTNKPANGTITLTNAGGEIPASASARRVVISGITNPSTPDTRYYMRFNTYNNTDCTSSPVDAAAVTFILTFSSTLSLTVDQTLSFTVNSVAAGQNCNGATSTQPSTATTIPFGTVTAAANGVVCQDLTAATNATNGYTIHARDTAQPTNGLGQTIANHTGTNAAPTAFSAAGTEAYGYTTNDASLGTGTPGRFITNNWAAMTTTNAEVAYEPIGVSSTTYRVGHQVGVSLTTRPGTYQTTVIYTCTPVY